MNKRKIIVFHPALAPYRIDLFNELNRLYDADFYFTLNNLKDQKFDQERLKGECNFKVNILSSGFELGGRSLRFGIFKILRQTNPEIVICSEYSQITFSVILYKIFFNRKIRLYTISDDSVDLSVRRNGIRKRVREIASKYLNGVILSSSEVCKWYALNVSSKPKTIEIPIVHSNHVFREKLSKCLPTANENIKEYNLTGKKVFLFVGRFVKIKNPQMLIQAFAKRKNSDDILFFIGDGEERDSLHKLVSELNLTESCIFLGRYEGDKLLSWFNTAQCLILPSYQEPYGVVVNEALLAGCKVICSKLAGASALVDETNGYVFDPSNESELTKLIDLVYDNLNPAELLNSIRPDLMPFVLRDKTENLFSQL